MKYSSYVRHEDYRDFGLGGIAGISKSEISDITSGCYEAILGRSVNVTRWIRFQSMKEIYVLS